MAGPENERRRAIEDRVGNALLRGRAVLVFLRDRVEEIRQIREMGPLFEAGRAGKGSLLLLIVKAEALRSGISIAKALGPEEDRSSLVTLEKSLSTIISCGGTLALIFATAGTGSFFAYVAGASCIKNIADLVAYTTTGKEIFRSSPGMKAVALTAEAVGLLGAAVANGSKILIEQGIRVSAKTLASKALVRSIPRLQVASWSLEALNIGLGAIEVAFEILPDGTVVEREVMGDLVDLPEERDSWIEPCPLGPFWNLNPFPSNSCPTRRPPAGIRWFRELVRGFSEENP